MMDWNLMEWTVYVPVMFLAAGAYTVLWIYLGFYAWRGLKQLLPVNVGASLIMLVICMIIPYILAPVVYATLAFDKGKAQPLFHRRDC